MISDVSGRKLITNFKHVYPNKQTGEPGGTWCYIKVFDPSKKDEEREIVSIGFTVLYHKDEQFNKQVGRKWALQYALGLDKKALWRQHTKGRKDSGSCYDTKFTKAERAAIWQEYWRSHRIGPVNKVKLLEGKVAALEAQLKEQNAKASTSS